MKFTLPFLVAVLLLQPISGLDAQQSGVEIGGYGELHYTEPDGPTKGTLELHRFNLQLTKQLSEKWSVHSALELLNTAVADDAPGRLSVEHAYAEYQLWEKYGFRGGILLVPVGLLNERHAPTAFHGVERPGYHSVLIPTTWREAGIGFYGTPWESLTFRVYAVTSLKAEGFTGKDGFGQGSQSGILASTADMALTGRVEYRPMPHLDLGTSFFTGGTTGGCIAGGTVAILTGDIRMMHGNAALQAEGMISSLADADMINDLVGTSVADAMNGWYVEASYDVMPHLLANIEQQLTLFARYERYNTHARVSGFPADPAFHRTDITAGISYAPIDYITLKLDYQFFSNETDDDAVTQLNAGLGFQF